MLNPGNFRHKIIFMQTLKHQDELGQWIDGEPTPFKKVWSDIKTMKGNEYLAAAQAQAERTYRFIIRYTKGITTDMTIDFKGRIFDIVEPPINDDEANVTITIIAKERI